MFLQVTWLDVRTIALMTFELAYAFVHTLVHAQIGAGFESTRTALARERAHVAVTQRVTSQMLCVAEDLSALVALMAWRVKVVFRFHVHLGRNKTQVPT